MYIVFKYISSIKKTLVVSDLVLAQRGSENVFDCRFVFKNKVITRDDFHEF